MTGAVTEAIRRYDACHTAMLAALDAVGDEDLDRATPCPEWDLRRLVEHVSDVAHALARLARTGVLTLDPAPGAEPGDPVTRARSELRQAARVIHEAADSDDADTREHAVSAAQSGAVELAGHGWDVTTALGAAPTLPDPDAECVLALATGLLVDAPRGSHFGPPILADRTRTVADDLAAFLGRRPRR